MWLNTFSGFIVNSSQDSNGHKQEVNSISTLKVVWQLHVEINYFFLDFLGDSITKIPSKLLIFCD